MADLTDAGGLIPDKFKIDKLSKVSLHQIAFWDKMHKKVRKGQVAANGTNYQVRFKRDETGKVNATGGEYIANKGTQLNMKYAEEVRLCLGVAKCKLEDGTVVGKRLPLFDYSGKVILTIKDYNKKVMEELARVRGLKGKGGWVTLNRIDGQMWDTEELSLVKGIGPKLEAKFAEKGIDTIGDLRCGSAERISLIAEKGLSIRVMNKFKILVANALVGEPPPSAILLDHQINPLETNPYKSR